MLAGPLTGAFAPVSGFFFARSSWDYGCAVLDETAKWARSFSIHHVYINMAMSGKRSDLGRKPKFQEPSSSITITLPDRILQQLSMVDADRAKGIVKCVENTLAENKKSNVSVLKISEKEGLLTVGPCSLLNTIPHIKLIEISPLHYIISKPVGIPIETIEIGLIDMIEKISQEQHEEKEMLMKIRTYLKTHRESDSLQTREIILLNIPEENN